MDKAEAKILIVAAGTGGHVFPALCIAKLLLKTFKVSWVGTDVGIENAIVPQANIPFFTIHMSGVRKNGMLRLLFLPFRLLRALLESCIILLRERPHVVVGFGGYVTFPVCLSAFILRIPILIHEQNARFGLSNKIISYFANNVMLAYSQLLPPTLQARHKYVYVGNPVRQDILAIAEPSKRYVQHQQLKLLIVGGSLGAATFNQLLPEVAAKLTNIVVITHQVGKNQVDKVQKHYQRLAINNVTVVEFITDMADAYAKHDIIICRAGAMAVSEVMAAGIAAIFIPYPYAVDDHQYYNALPLAQHQAAYLLRQADATVGKLTDLLISLDADKCLNLAIRAHSLAKLDSSMLIEQTIQQYV